MKRKSSSRIYKRTIALKILKSNLNECVSKEFLNKQRKIRAVVRVTKEFLEEIIPIKDNHIPLNYYYDFLSAIPFTLWCREPTFYYHPEIVCWDALGFLGEKIHKSTLRTKYLELCFAKLGFKITEVLDNEEPNFESFKDNKIRFLSAIKYLEENLEERELKLLLIKSKKLCDERYKDNIEQ